jgi:toxin YoeB
MKRSIIIEPAAFQSLVTMGKQDVKLLSKTMNLIQDCLKSPFDGLGKPEPLRHNLKGYWSRRINDEHRLIYKVDDEKITIISCRDHY